VRVDVIEVFEAPVEDEEPSIRLMEGLSESYCKWSVYV